MRKFVREDGRGLTIPNGAELVVTVFLGAVVGEACRFLDQNAIIRGHESKLEITPGQDEAIS